MLEQGEVAPNFTLVADDGSTVSLSDFRGQKVVVYFYPKADTPGCTKQACAIRDAYPQIEAGDAVVIGISPDSPEQLVKFREKYDLPFILLSDPDNEVAKAYGAGGETNVFGNITGGIVRRQFGADEAGRLTEVALKVRPLTTSDLALRLLDV